MVKRMGKRLLAFMLAIVFSAALVPTMPASAATEIKIGDYVQMGTYYGEPILWRCVAFEKISGYDENGNPIIDSTDTVTEYQEGYLPLMLSDKIICIKPFDAKTSENGETDSHSRNFNRGNYGSNYWAESNMRSWLNSSAASGDVEWLCGNSPSEDYVENGYNDYADEAGFLTNFTQSELNAVKEVTQKSFVSKPEYENGIYEAGTEGYEYSPNISDIITNYDTAYAEYVTDKIFLPDIKQADEIYKNSDILGDNYHVGEPTVQCVANSEYIDSGLSAESKWHYWLRTPRSDDSNGVRYVYSIDHVYIRSAYRGDSGVRPAFYLDLSSFTATSGEGTESNPYVCGEDLSNKEDLPTINIGDYVQMGTYYGEPILWRCVDIDENGPLMLSDKIICLKPYDAVTSANSATDSHSRGRSDASNYWADSNMRSWLNSTENNVNWLCANPPSEDYVLDGHNDYADEAGFLTNFTQAELNAVKEVTQKSLVSSPEYENGIYEAGTARHSYNSGIADVVANYDTAYAEDVTDKMFLMDIKQVNAVYSNSSILGEDYYIGEPTAQCVANSEYVSGSLAEGKKWHYWLRTPHSNNYDGVRDVSLDGNVYNNIANLGYLGVRPAFYLNLSSFTVTSGEGTESNPYVCGEDLSNKEDLPTINIGDYVQMGTYYGEPILWRCVDIDENGPLILSDKIICLKPYDAKASEKSTTGSHSRNPNRDSWGSNYWADSNIRSWLNSSESTGNVKWLCENPPSEDYVMNGYNDYADEAGFLTNFTQAELNAVKAVEQKSLASSPEYESGIYTMGTEGHEYNSDIDKIMQNYDTAYAEYVTDKFFLLDVKQLNALYNNESVLGENYYISEPMAQCVANSEYTSSGLDTGKKWCYWLRSPYSDYNDRVRYVGTDGIVGYDIAYVGVRGIRPAFYLNLSTFAISSGEGTESNPYVGYGDTADRVDLSTVGKYCDSITVTAANTDGVLDVELDIIDAEITDEDITVYAAQYDGDSLVSVVMLAPSVSEEKIVYSGNITSDNYRIFIWDKDFVPVTYSYENN